MNVKFNGDWTLTFPNTSVDLPNWMQSPGVARIYTYIYIWSISDENIRSQANHLLELKPQAGPLMGAKNWNPGPEITQKDSQTMGDSEKHVHQNFTELDDGNNFNRKPHSIWW